MKQKDKPRRDAATVNADYRGRLTQLVDLALGDYVKPHLLQDMLEAQLTRLRMYEASKPW
jgi:hypothetical protein